MRMKTLVLNLFLKYSYSKAVLKSSLPSSNDHSYPFEVHSHTLQYLLHCPSR